MEQTVPLSFLMWLVGFLCSLLGGCWAIFKYFEAKLNRAYKRMDENKTQFYADFVTKAVYEAETRARKEMIDERFSQTIILFNEKIESLRTEIRNAIKNVDKGSHS